jgi:hypothetical protein
MLGRNKRVTDRPHFLLRAFERFPELGSNCDLPFPSDRSGTGKTFEYLQNPPFDFLEIESQFRHDGWHQRVLLQQQSIREMRAVHLSHSSRQSDFLRVLQRFPTL